MVLGLVHSSKIPINISQDCGKYLLAENKNKFNKII
jgi:hypothetical protein